ncbi:hypothetical protein Glove_543g114 [Diversispora epigaea]|uniref:Reverse transcriptase domain-containing protein n=1 Tax=Diversispora epigaea TaxID=1348612 RepID=A0A397GE45_9GLOM|nr:hypothetical protein Glove_543g114 [Diversispora epigaea]
MLKIAEEFCEIVDISINAEKSQVLHICPKKGDEIISIQVKDQQVIPVKKSTPIRYLRVWLTQSGLKSFQKNLIIEKVKNVCRILKWQQATDKLIRYILNHVPFPQIEYLNKVGFARSAMNSIFFISGGYRLFNIQNRQILMHGVNWLKKVNVDNDVSLSTQIHLQQYQNATWHHESVLNSLTVINIKMGHNLTGDILRMLKIIDFKFHICTTLPGSLTFPSRGFIPITECKDAKWFNKHCQSLKNRRIMFFDQLFNIDFSTFLHWPHVLTFIKEVMRRAIPGSLTFPSRGFIPITECKDAKWFNKHCQSLKNRRIMFFDQLFNIDFSTFLHWPHVLTFIKEVMRRAIPALYNTPIIQNKIMGMKEFHNFINSFIDMCSPFKTKDEVWYSQRNKGQYNIGKLTREKSLEDALVDDYITQHFVQVSKGLEPTSIVRPCKKCSININTKGNNPRCLIAINKSEVIQIPVKKNKKSTSNTRHNQMEKRIVMPAKDIRNCQ